MPFKLVEGRPAGFDITTVTQDAIEKIEDSELANKIEKTRTEVLKFLGHDTRKQRIKASQQVEEIKRPDPQNIECPICSLVTTTGQRAVMTKVEEIPQDVGDRDWDPESFIHDQYYHCANCNTRIYRDDPAFEDLSHVSPHDSLQVVAINDPNSDEQKPIMVSKQNKFSKSRSLLDRQSRLDSIISKLDKL